MSILPSFHDIAYFLEVAQTKNISRAAERLGITQPSLSSAMKRLEDSLGCQLITRSRAGVQLTKSGHELSNQGRRLLQSWEQIRTEINRRENDVSGQYVIGCHPSVGLYTLPHFLPQLLQNYPDLEIKLFHDLSRKITESVISFNVDFGIVVNPVQHPDLVIKELCKDEVSFWIAKKPSSTQDIKSENAVLICDNNLAQVQKILSDLQKQKIHFKRVIHSSSLEVITELTMAGVGIGILPQRVATRHKIMGLQKIKQNLPTFKDKICLIYRADTQKTRGKDIIIESIKSEIKA